MSTPFLGEVRTFSFNYPPKGWALANGQLLAINQNQALFSLLGTNYGGNGQTTFGLPNLQGRVAVGIGSNGGITYNVGNTGGSASVALTAGQVPVHTHNASGSTSTKSIAAPANSLPATYGTAAYATSADGTLAGGTVGAGGGGQAHENRQPYLTVSLCIALQGIFPSRS